jgi:hypothetical protein
MSARDVNYSLREGGGAYSTIAHFGGLFTLDLENPNTCLICCERLYGGMCVCVK